jgi:hypothetical protein
MRSKPDVHDVAHVCHAGEPAVVLANADKDVALVVSQGFSKETRAGINVEPLPRTSQPSSQDNETAAHLLGPCSCRPEPLRTFHV